MHSSGDPAPGRRPAPGTEPPAAERPRAEPEIIPPGADFPPPPRQGGTVVYTRDGTRIHVRRLGPFGIAAVLLGLGVAGILGLLFLLGAVLVGAAALGVVVLTALIARLLRGPSRR